MLTPVIPTLKQKKKGEISGPPDLVTKRPSSANPTLEQLLSFTGALRAELVYGKNASFADEYIAMLAALYVAHLRAAVGRKYDGEAVKHYLMAANAAEVFHVATRRYEGGPTLSPIVPHDAAAWCEFAALETAVCATTKMHAGMLLGVAQEAATILTSLPGVALFWRARAAVEMGNQVQKDKNSVLLLRYWTTGKIWFEEALKDEAISTHTRAEIKKQLDQLVLQRAKLCLARGVHVVSKQVDNDEEDQEEPLIWPEPAACSPWSDAVRKNFQKLLVAASDAYWAPRVIPTTPLPAAGKADLKMILGISEAELLNGCRDKAEARRIVVAALRGATGERHRFVHMRGEMDGTRDVSKLLGRLDESLRSLFVQEEH